MITSLKLAYPHITVLITDKDIKDIENRIMDKWFTIKLA